MPYEPFVVADPGSIFLGTTSGLPGIVVFWEGTKARIFCENSWWIFNKNPVDIRVGYILCWHNFGQNAIVRPWSIIWAFFHHIENNSDDKNLIFPYLYWDLFRFQVLFSDDSVYSKAWLLLSRHASKSKGCLSLASCMSASSAIASSSFVLTVVFQSYEVFFWLQGWKRASNITKTRRA